jgi:hypothetical protein
MFKKLINLSFIGEKGIFKGVIKYVYFKRTTKGEGTFLDLN